MNIKFSLFSEKLIEAIKDQVISIVEFGSDKGENYPDLSDIDILIISKDKRYTNQIFFKARAIEKEILGINHSRTSDVLEKKFLFSNDLSGVHLIVLSRDELDANWQPKSIRLKIITRLIISRTIFLYNIKHKHRLLYGKDFSGEIKIPKLNFFDRITPFTLPVLVLLTLPIIITRHRKFEIWCFKALKYHGENLLSYSQIYFNNDAIALHDLKLHELTIDLAQKYRYHPEQYKNNIILLYFRTWACLIYNLPFVWMGPKLVKEFAAKG